MSYEIKIENFEGPLDLLLHLIRKNEMDICDIAISAITEQYLATIDAMKNLNLDLAGEFLLMAATLVHIKSRMLLPQAEDEGDEADEADPRAELVRRLLEYQKYKEGAKDLDALPLLGREVFGRKFPSPELAPGAETEFHEVGLYELVEALRELLKARPEEMFHEVTAERLSVAARIQEILGLLSGRESLAFAELLPQPVGRDDIVVTFLAMLELVKLRMVRLLQTTRFGSIRLYPAVTEVESEAWELAEESLGYS